MYSAMAPDSARVTGPSWITGAPPVTCLSACQLMDRGGWEGIDNSQSLDLRWSQEVILPPRIILQLIWNLKLFA